MLDLSPTNARILKLGTATFIIAVAAAIIFSQPNTPQVAQKPAAEAAPSIDPNDRSIVTVSSMPAANPISKH